MDTLEIKNPSAHFPLQVNVLEARKLHRKNPTALDDTHQEPDVTIVEASDALELKHSGIHHDTEEVEIVEEETDKFFLVSPATLTIPPGETQQVTITVKERENLFHDLQSSINDIFLLVKDVRLAKIPGKKVAVSLLTRSEPVVSTRSGLEIDTSSLVTERSPPLDGNRMLDDLPVLVLRVLLNFLCIRELLILTNIFL